ncbi:MAG: hypothetical protein AB3N18_00720 [Allomuricauda sp.]
MHILFKTINDVIPSLGKNNILLFSLIVFLGGCSKDKEQIPTNPEPVLGKELNFGYIETDKGLYSTNERVILPTLSLTNVGTKESRISKISVFVSPFSDLKIQLAEKILVEGTVVLPGKTIEVPSNDTELINTSVNPNAYGVFANITFSDGTQKKEYLTFFRVGNGETQANYQIEEQEYQGLPVYTLKNGLSAEYTVQKSVANFVSGISHSWETPLSPIASTPDFLERSLDYTVEFYNDKIGATTPLETVILGTGIPGVPYVARTMNALVLPLHFLVGSGTVREVETILQHANENGYSTYGTLGYDYSISTDTGVAWIKLLDLPSQYKKFIDDHQVKNVVLYGHLGTNDGETVARKVKDERAKYETGSLYLMHFSGDASEGFLNQVISDFNPTNLAEEERIADWEAGIVSEQIQSLSTSLKANTSVSNIMSVTAEEGVHLWNMGTYSSLAFIKKNETIFSDNGARSPIEGVSLNPYLIAHPGFESYIRHIPFLYWQGFSPEFQYNNWLGTKIKTALLSYFPDTVFENLQFWVNSTQNFGGLDQGNSMAAFLLEKGFSVQKNNFAQDEIWNPNDGMDSPSEVRASLLLESIPSIAYKNWNEQMKYLSPQDLIDISNTFPEIQILSH